MMWQQSEKYKNKYRIPPARAEWWNYGANGAYFITICTQNREHFFGEIENDEMRLSNVGVIADVFWNEIPKHFDFIELGAFVVMSNHIHGILIMNKNDDDVVDNANADTNTDANGNGNVEKRHCLFSTNANTNTEIDYRSERQKRFQNQGKKTISSIVGGYKSVVTRHAHRLKYDFTWQTSFHDHIIRDLESYRNIENYICTNPQKWADDRYSKNDDEAM